MAKSLRKQGYMQSSAVVIYPRVAGEGEEDEKKQKQFMCADGMHRVRCVTELAERKAAGEANIQCGDMVYAIILRPDTPSRYLIQLSLSKYSFLLHIGKYY